MFEKVRNKYIVQRTRSLLAEDIIIMGDISSSNDMYIEGNVQGDICCTGKLVVGVTGCVEGNLHCPVIEVLGNVNGDIYADKSIILHSSSFLKGDIKASYIEIAPGACFIGNYIKHKLVVKE